jgi:hypothetical protein
MVVAAGDVVLPRPTSDISSSLRIARSTFPPMDSSRLIRFMSSEFLDFLGRCIRLRMGKTHSTPAFVQCEQGCTRSHFIFLDRQIVHDSLYFVFDPVAVGDAASDVAAVIESMMTTICSRGRQPLGSQSTLRPWRHVCVKRSVIIGIFSNTILKLTSEQVIGRSRYFVLVKEAAWCKSSRVRHA